MLLPWEGQERWGEEVLSRSTPALLHGTGCDMLVAGTIPGGCSDGDKHRSCIISAFRCLGWEGA